MTIQLPFPPSTNNAYANVRGRRVKTKEARDYGKTVQEYLMASKDARAFRANLPKAPRFAVRFDIHEADRKRRDLINTEKLLIDAAFKWLGYDDSRIDHFVFRRAEPMQPARIIVTIEEAA